MANTRSMDRSILVGTAGGLWSLTGERATPVEALAGRTVTAPRLIMKGGSEPPLPP
jgi:hypothetical protein